MKEIIIQVVNAPLQRMVIGFIMAGTAASPFINDFSDSIIWLISGIIFMSIVTASTIYGFRFTERNAWIVYTIFLIFGVLLVCLFFSYGR